MRGLHFVTIVPPGPHGHVLFGLDDTHPEHDEFGFGVNVTAKLNPIKVATAVAKSPLIKPVPKPGPVSIARVVTAAGVAVHPAVARPPMVSAFVVPRTGVSAIAAVGMADKLINAAKTAKPANLPNVAKAAGGVTTAVANAAVAHAQQIVAQAKTAPTAAGTQIAALTKLADAGHPQSQATVAVLKAVGQAQAATNIVAATTALAKAGDVDANRALGVVKARLDQRASGRRFTFTMTPDGRIHHEPETETTVSGDDSVLSWSPISHNAETIFGWGKGNVAALGANRTMASLAHLLVANGVNPNAAGPALKFWL